MKGIIESMTEASTAIGLLSGEVMEAADQIEAQHKEGGDNRLEYRASIIESLRFIVSNRLRDQAAALLHLNFELIEITFYLHALHLLEGGIDPEAHDGDDETLARLLDFLKFGDDDDQGED